MSTPFDLNGSRSGESLPAGVDIEDLLPRPPVKINRTALRDCLAERTVLVTGAGGSIGTELSSQLAALQPARLVLVDMSEYNLFRLESGLCEKHPGEALIFCLGDVRDRALMEGLFEEFRPDVVLHAAAYKHVPLMERHPIEAFRNNTLTTTRLLDLCEAYGTEQFVFVSTDKAVEPVGVLGATKRLAEDCVRNAPLGGSCKIVRFGNVFGTQGSVVETFVRQIAEGGPVTVTHPEMKRYFMSAHEACSLILQTLLLNGAPVYFFDMAEPVRIAWLARRLIRRLRPDADPEALIEYVGIRPGEKLSETLWASDEAPIATAHERIRGVTGPLPASHIALERHLKRLERLCRKRRPEALRAALFRETLERAGQEA